MIDYPALAALAAVLIGHYAVGLVITVPQSGRLTRFVGPEDLANIIAVEEVPEDQTHQYGIVSVGQEFGQTFEITGMVEKPPKGTAPSNYIISGRYILQPEIFDLLSNQQRGAGNEIQLTDSMIRLMKDQKFYGMKYEGRTYDTGSKVGFLMANVAYALEREAFGSKLADKQTVQNWIADSAAEIQACRLMTLDAARKLDEGGEARVEVSLIKFYAAKVLHDVVVDLTKIELDL